MAKRRTRDDWFAAASACDLWARPGTGCLPKCCSEVGADLAMAWVLLDGSERAEVVHDASDEGYLTAQIGCERAGL